MRDLMPRSGKPGELPSRCADAIAWLSNELGRKGYVHVTTLRHLRAARHLLLWADAQGIVLRAIDDTFVARFRRHLSTCRCAGFHARAVPHQHAEAARGARFFVACLREAGVLKPSPAQEEFAPAHSLVAGFSEWMRGTRGVTSTTVRIYRAVAVDILDSFPDLEGGLAADALRSFVLARCRKSGTSKAKQVVTGMRMFLRYLATQGVCSASLVYAVPGVAHWRLSSLPRYLTAPEVERVVRACDATTPVGLRDRAIVLLLARLGLRAGDIIALRLSDIDWRESTISVTGKSRRAVRLPLSQEVGNAVLAYLRRGRPRLESDRVFLRALAPWGALNWHGAVSSLVGRAIRRAGVPAPSHGAHVLRHSAATEMLRQGASLQTIGAVLRHRSVDTTTQYAKVDVQSLSQVALAWQGAVP